MQWRKIWVVASTEFLNAVRTKAFVVGVLMLPLIYGLAIFVQAFANRADTRTRAFAVVDHTGVLYPEIQKAAESYNKLVAFEGSKQVRPRFEPENATDPKRPTEAVLLALSDRVRAGELFAFVEIPAGLIEPGEGQAAAPASQLRYFTNTPTDFDLPGWLEGVINTEVRNQRIRKLGLDPGLVSRVMMPIRTETLGLLDRAATTPKAGPAGATTPAAPAAPTVKAAEKVDMVRTVGPPIALVFVLFIVILTTTPQLMQTVLEEKMSKISEVMLGSVSPFQLMLGKLLGNVGVALLLAGLYLGAALGVAAKFGYSDMASPYLLASAALFIFLGVMLFGSLFMAVGAACSDLKDAQSLMFPVMMLAMLPAFFWMVVLRQPSSPLAVGMSLFPPATPFLMLMRMALSPAPPPWQVLLSIALTTLAALACVWAAGKIFRTGLLMTGKAPSFAELGRWVLAR